MAALADGLRGRFKLAALAPACAGAIAAASGSGSGGGAEARAGESAREVAGMAMVRECVDRGRGGSERGRGGSERRREALGRKSTQLIDTSSWLVTCVEATQPIQ